MNRLLRITKDEDIISGNATASQEDVELYEDELGPGPALDPMQPHWQNLKSAWNESLGELFLQHLKQNIAVEAEFEDEILEMFYNRLKRLRRLLTGASPLEGENVHQARRRAEQKKVSALARQRPNTRRQQVSH